MIYAVIAGAVVLVVVLVGGIVAGARRKARHNESFLAGALAATELPPSTSVQVPVTLAAGAHAVWLDLELTGGAEVRFELALAIELGGRMILDGRYPVVFDDDEHDARGLPNPPGVSALNTSVASLPGRTRITTTLRAFRFDAPAAGAVAQIRATFVPGPDLTVARSRLLVTSPDAPTGSGSLPAGMRAIG